MIIIVSIPWHLIKVQKSKKRNYPVFSAFITEAVFFFHDKLVITLRHIWQAKEKWVFYNAMNKHLLLEYLLYFTGFNTVEVY